MSGRLSAGRGDPVDDEELELELDGRGDGMLPACDPLAAGGGERGGGIDAESRLAFSAAAFAAASFSARSFSACSFSFASLAACSASCLALLAAAAALMAWAALTDAAL